MKFHLGQKVIVIKTGIVVTIAGLDRGPHVCYPYLVVGDKLETGQLASDGYLENNYPERMAVGTVSHLEYDIFEEFHLKSFEDEKAEILAQVNPVYVRRFESGAVRSDDRGREKPSFVSPYAIKFVAEHFSKNAAFFNDRDSAKNYFKGIKPVDIEDSLERHMLDFKFAMMPQNAGNVGPIKQALTEIMANCVMALHQIGLEEDGLYKEVYPTMEYVKKED